MSDDLDNFLEHFGIKGMRWGVRRSSGSSGPKMSKLSDGKGRYYTKEDEKYIKTFVKKHAMRVYSESLNEVNKKALESIRVDPSNIAKITSATMSKALVENMNKRLVENGLSKTPSGDYTIYADLHADGNFSFETSYRDDSVKHSDFLSHVGVKGMRWGVRRKTVRGKLVGSKVSGVKVASVRGKPVVTVSNPRALREATQKAMGVRGAGAKAEKKAENRKEEKKRLDEDFAKKKAARDAKKLARIEAKAKKAKPEPAKMTTKELQERVNRMNLEKQYNKLSKPGLSTGQKVAAAILVGSATTVGTTFVSKYMTTGVKAAETAVTRLVKK